MNPDILTWPSSTLMSRLSKVDWFKGQVKMSEFFVGDNTNTPTKRKSPGKITGNPCMAQKE